MRIPSALRAIPCSALGFVVLIHGPAESQQPAAIGALLEPGMQLVYSSGGVQSPWSIDSIVRDTAIADRNGCLRLRLRTAPAPAAPESRAHCADATTMFTWDERAGQLRPARPITPGAMREIPLRSGGFNRFETSAVAVERIPRERGMPPVPVAPLAIDVIPTVVTTVDSTGKVVRRLRERFATGLGTATGGVFEVPDSSQAGGWRTVRAFELVAIRLP